MALAEFLERVEIETGTPPTGSVIWLHGLGADGHDFEPIVPELRLPSDLALRFVFPHAPVRPVTLNGGYPMRAWFDLARIGLQMPTDVPGLEASRQAVEALIARENDRGIATGRIVLAGFSQGGAVALYTGLQYREKLAGIMGLSTFLPLVEGFRFDVSSANAATSVFLAHGLADPVVPFALAQHTRDALTARGVPLVWHTYPMPHSVCAEEIVHLRAWLLSLLQPAGA